MSASNIYLQRLEVPDALRSAPALSSDFLRGLAAGIARARTNIPEALYFYDTGRHVGFTEGRILGYREGRAAGFAEGLEALTEGIDAERRQWLDSHNRDLAARLSSTPSFAELCDLRGDPQRATRQRQILAERRIDA